MALVGTISGSNGTSNTAVTGTLVIANQPNATFPQIPADSILYVSAALDLKDGSTPGVATFATDIVLSGSSYYQAITTPATTTQGRVFLDNNDYALSMFTETGVKHRLGRSSLIRAKNADTTTISKGNAVRIATSVGSNLTVVRSIATTAQAITTETNQIIGIAAEDVAVNGFGYFCNKGQVYNLDTSGLLTEGGVIYVSSVTSGSLTQTQPAAPYEIIKVGTLVRSHGTQGVIMVDIVEPTHLNDITGFNADPTTWTNGSSVVYDSNTATWKTQRNGYNLSGSFNGAFSGSLTKLSDGTSYLIAGTNTTVVTNSNGSVTITAVPSGSDTQVQFNDGGSVFGASSGFTFSKATNSISVTGNITGSNGLLNGNLALNGGSLTSTAATFNLVNANVTTVNFAGGASTALNIGNTAATNTVLGQTKFSQGLSGSLTKLTDGTSYITQGVNVAVTTASNGSVSIASNNIPVSFLGDASDGSATLDGVATFTWVTLAGSVYTMTRDALLRDLTINNTITLRTQGYLPYVKGTLTNNGTYEAKGNDASGVSVGGAFSNAGSFAISAGSGGSGAGPTTGNGTGNPGNGSGGNSIGGSGGNGGTAGAQAGGTGNNSAAPASTLGSWRDLGFLIRKRLFSGATVNSLNGSGGGGGGAVNGDGVNSGTGGGGGGASPNCYVFCDTLNNGGTIRTIGGSGGNGVSAGGTTKAGGGGGGAGGGIIIAANTVTALGTVTSVGGSIGSGANGGSNGSPGTAGTVLILTGS